MLTLLHITLLAKKLTDSWHLTDGCCLFLSALLKKLATLQHFHLFGDFCVHEIGGTRIAVAARTVKLEGRSKF